MSQHEFKEYITPEIIQAEVEATVHSAYDMPVGSVEAKHRLGWIAPSRLSPEDYGAGTFSWRNNRWDMRYRHMNSDADAIRAMNIASNYYAHMLLDAVEPFEAHEFMRAFCPELPEFRRALNRHAVGRAAVYLYSEPRYILNNLSD